MNMMPILYTPKTRYTSDTNVLVPLLVAFTRAGAIAMLEWFSLRFVDSAPVAVWLATGVFAAAVLAVLQTKDWLDFNGRWYFTGAILLVLVGWIAVSAFGYWKYPPQEKPIPTFPTAEQIAEAIARNLPKAPPPIPSQQTPPSSASNNDQILNQARTERDKAQRELTAMTAARDSLARTAETFRIAVGPTSRFLGLTDAKRWILMAQLHDALVNQIPLGQRCHAFLATKPNSSSAAQFWDEFSTILNYTNWILEGGANRSVFPSGITIEVAADKGTAFACGWKLSELLESMNVGPVSFRANQTTPNLLRCPECTEIVIGDVTVH
jgi:hypothetical protein